ncbi:uncharacterized protein LOC116248298 isoform X2 [Nymphaea colorata]|uniref:uncharacterized protein LOC116248298 isoform X2 n=1 Tax=Nymphaea colorata TaxID=210225 RepID=UPI00214EACC3|nr:uncharacterized protein LOC116248298 isoform X2 [Nymphaea colorata]
MASSNGEGETRVLIAHSKVPFVLKAQARGRLFWMQIITTFYRILAAGKKQTNHRIRDNGIDSNSFSSEDFDNCLLSLRHPKSGKPTSYVLLNGTLQEIHWFKQPFGSWFVGDYVCEDGGLYVATPIDPVFIFLPIFEEARMKRGDELGVFRNLDEILFVHGYPAYSHLLPFVEESMHVVCEVKEVGSMKFYRLDDLKVLAWLCQKVEHLKSTLPTLNEMYSLRDEKDTLMDAVSLLGEYLKDDPWLKQLCQHLRLNMEETDKKARIIEPVPFVSEASPVQNGRERNTPGNKKQPKKMKVETGSKNIKDMFRSASKKGT